LLCDHPRITPCPVAELELIDLGVSPLPVGAEIAGAPQVLDLLDSLSAPGARTPCRFAVHQAQVAAGPAEQIDLVIATPLCNHRLDSLANDVIEDLALLLVQVDKMSRVSPVSQSIASPPFDGTGDEFPSD
jgi:hypothetical protein